MTDEKTPTTSTADGPHDLERLIEAQRTIKCRYCDYKVLAMVRYKNGNVAMGIDLLRGHVYSAHPSKIQLPKRKPPRHGNRVSRVTADETGYNKFNKLMPLDKIIK